MPVAHTRAARERLGSGPLIALSVACVLDDDAERGRATARGYAEMYLTLSNYTNNLLRHGFTEADIADGGSDRLIDEIVPHGSAALIARGRARAPGRRRRSRLPAGRRLHGRAAGAVDRAGPRRSEL